jgi:hypothetical protein
MSGKPQACPDDLKAVTDRLTGLLISLVPGFLWFQHSLGIRIPLVPGFLWFQHSLGIRIPLVPGFLGF